MRPVDLDGRPALILASGSPRRIAFMRASGIPVQVRPVDIDESPRSGEAAEVLCRRLAGEKARAGRAQRGPDDPAWVLGSDTVVVVDGQVLGKPDGPAEARRMLSRLSGRTHHVLTSWALAGPDAVHVETACTAVTFRALSGAEIDGYVATGDPLDKAGAYGIQSGAGSFVAAIEGSYDTVVGLPMADVCAALAARGIVLFPEGVAPRLAAIRGRMAAAAVAAGRDPASVTLVGVSKGQPLARLGAAWTCGVRDLGESYVQEWKGRIDALEDVRWHFIGRLQRNKARFVAARAARVHAVDSIRLAEALGRGAAEAGRVLPVLVQVNQAAEASKGGVAPDALADVLDAISMIEGLRCDGLMAIPPPGAAASYFAALRDLRDAHATEGRLLPHLSMGMSSDYVQAIGRGATLVRVGSALFGPRG